MKTPALSLRNIGTYLEDQSKTFLITLSLVIVLVLGVIDYQTGEEISISLEAITKTVRVLGLIEHRVGAKLVMNYLEDLTPESEYLKLKSRKESGFGNRLRGTGRPTKRDRREIEILKKYLGA